jgi:predicted DNA-binding ribbon-helix-helix protein
MTKKRRDMKRGPYMEEEVYDKLSKMADNKDMTIQDALNELVDKSVNSQGNIVVNPLEAKMGN